MTLPEPVRRFAYAAAELHAICRRTRWGLVMADPRYPDIWDANNAAVLEPDRTLRSEDLLGELHPALREAAASAEHIEFWELESSPALRELYASGNKNRADVAMVYDGSAREGERVRRIAVEEVSDPDPGLWDWYRASLNEFGSVMPDDVLDQLVARTREVFVPAGLRWFVGRIDGERAGYTSMVSLEGVAYLDDVVTMPPFRGRGVATATVLAAVRASADCGDATTFLLAEEGGAPQALYERLGFVARARLQSFTRALPPPS